MNNDELTHHTIELNDIKISNRLPLTLISGPCQLESLEHSMMIAEKQGVKVLPYSVNTISRSKTPLLNSYQVFDIVNNLSKFNTFFREILGIIAFKITSYT